MPALYLDSSAIVKLVVAEPQSSALRQHLRRRRRPLVSSALARTEVLRALLPQGEVGITRARAVLARVELVRLNERLLAAAGELRPAELRSLDAIHLATAQELGSDLSQLISYDERMLNAANQLGLTTASPG